MTEELQKKFSIIVDAETAEKLSDYKKINKISKVQIVQKALNVFFEKQDEKEILKAILLRLELLRLECQNLDLVGNRTNVFLNHYSENRLNAEDYKKIRADVIEEMKNLKTSKGYDKK